MTSAKPDHVLNLGAHGHLQEVRTIATGLVNNLAPADAKAVIGELRGVLDGSAGQEERVITLATQFAGQRAYDQSIAAFRHEQMSDGGQPSVRAASNGKPGSYYVFRSGGEDSGTSSDGWIDFFNPNS